MSDEKTELGRVLDPDELDTAEGPRALLRVEAPSDWLEAGGEVSVATPARLVCARCDGGGCDACGRSGALLAPAEIDARRITATLPEHSEGGVALRLVRPFGGEASIDQLILEIRPGPASTGLTRVEPAPLARRPNLRPLAVVATVMVLAAVAIGLVLGLR